MSRPNLLFIMTDHQRADSLGMVQSGVEVCPNLNRLASLGTRFTRAYDTCPLCVPARTALATGKYPTKNGVVVNDWKGVSAGDHATIHERLFQAGYGVAHVGVDHIRVKPSMRERMTFALWESGDRYAEHAESAGLDKFKAPKGMFSRRVKELRQGDIVESGYSNANTATWGGQADDFKDLFWCREAADFIKKDRSKPFALFLYLWAPHPPLVVPEPYASKFDPDKLDLPSNVGIPSEGEPADYRCGVPAQLAEGLTEEDWRKTWAAHLGLVNMADEGIGRVLEAAGKAGNGKETLKVFTVDHGDHLGQHRMYQKMEMYEQAVRVPLIFAGPGIGERVVDVPVSHLDVKPTLLEWFDLPVPGDLDGISLASTLGGGGGPPSRPVFMHYSGNPVPGVNRRAVVDGRFKYVFSPPDGRELYDLEADPLEMSNLAGDPENGGLVTRLHDELSRWGREKNDALFFDK